MEEKEFKILAINIFIRTLENVAKEDINMLPPSAELLKGIVSLWNSISSNTFLHTKYFRIILFAF